MVQRIALALYALSLAAVVAQTTNAPAPAAPPAPAAETPVEPLSATRADNTRYQLNPSLLADCQARLDAINGKPCDVIFIGDSITSDWLGAGNAVWKEKYEPRHALNFGVTGDKTQNVLWRLNNMSVQELKPKVAVVLIGKNNLANSAHEIADGVKAVIATTQMVFPGVKVILVSIPSNPTDEDKIMQTDKLLRHLADDTSVFYLDLVPLMTPSTVTGPNGLPVTKYKGLGPDGVHLDASGYQMWADAMEPLLAKLFGG